VSTAATLLVTHGYAVLFAYVLVSQLGAPLPSGPLLVAAGALAATGRLGLGPAIAIAWIASLSADAAWYALGRARGGTVLRFLCRVSLEPAACVRRTKNAVGRYGARFLLIAKFFPGLGLMVAPIAGQTRMRFLRFFAFDSMGALVWICTYALLGLFLGEWIEKNAHLFQTAARFGLAAVVGVATGLVAIRLMRRRRWRRLLSIARITPTELKGRMDVGEPVYVVDLRDPLLLDDERYSLPGAVHLTPEQLLARKDAIPTDREIVLFCDCPEEASAVLVAVELQRNGLQRVRPLAGGLDGWQLAGYPLECLADDLVVREV
jgi:membrane protein DedA with SNARE-associated domain/rhodanese-related sulfurtransferase